MKYLFAAFLTAASLTLVSPVQAQSGHACDGKVESLLQEIDLSPDEISSIRVDIDWREQTGAQCIIPDSKAWISLKSCQGNLVFDFRKECSLKSAFTTGNCRVEGLERIL